MPDPNWYVEHGNKYPYDASDAWRNNDEPPPPPIDWAHSAARGVLADLTDRRGIKYGFDDVDEDVRAEIVETLAAIIRSAAPNTSDLSPADDKD